MKSVWLLLGVISALHIGYASGAVCKQKTQRTITEYYKVATGCGWWGWSTCYSQKSRLKTVEAFKSVCCTGSYGEVSNDCPGVCPYKSAKSSVLCPGNRICRDYQCDKSGVDGSSLPSVAQVTLSENDDNEKLLWSVKATCFVQYSCKCGSSLCKCSKTVDCDRCTVTSTNNVAEVKNGVEIYRRACENTKCRDCSNHHGCLNAGNYTISVECQASGYLDNGLVRQELTLVVEEANEVQIDLQLPEDQPGDIEVRTDSPVGSVVLSLGHINIPDTSSPEFTLTQNPETNTPLFRYDNVTKEIKVATQLSGQSSGRYTVTFCVVLRRQDTCLNATVEILRTTTTSTTTSTTTETTSTTTTTTSRPELDDGYVCDAQPEWKELPLMDWWCNLICGPDPENCPYLHTHCRCTEISDDRVTCRSGGFYVENDQMRDHMDYWCNLNCNYAEYSNCPTDKTQAAYCECDPVRK